MKENRDKIVCKLRSLHSCNDVDNLLSTLGNAESGVTYSLSSFGLETEASTLTKEGNRLQLRPINGVNYGSTIVAMHSNVDEMPYMWFVICTSVENWTSC